MFFRKCQDSLVWSTQVIMEICAITVNMKWTLENIFCILLFWNGFTSNYVGLGIELKETLAAKLGDLRISHLLAVFGPFAGSTKKLVSCWGLGCTAVLNTAYAGESRVYIYIYRCFLFQFRIT